MHWAIVSQFDSCCYRAMSCHHIPNGIRTSDRVPSNEMSLNLEPEAKAFISSAMKHVILYLAVIPSNVVINSVDGPNAITTCLTRTENTNEWCHKQKKNGSDDELNTPIKTHTRSKQVKWADKTKEKRQQEKKLTMKNKPPIRFVNDVGLSLGENVSVHLGWKQPYRIRIHKQTQQTEHLFSQLITFNACRSFTVAYPTTSVDLFAGHTFYLMFTIRLPFFRGRRNFFFASQFFFRFFFIFRNWPV